ncbi:MAG: GNAT family protein [Pseudomonadota bacterium]
METGDLSNWRAPLAPPDDLGLEGRYVRLEPFDPARHANPIHARAEAHPEIWDYMLDGPHADGVAYGAAITQLGAPPDINFFALYSKDLGDFGGHASFLRINPTHGSIELGHILLTPSLRQSRAATEAWALMMGWAFEAGYRRFEWKCNALNASSCRAAERLGFTFEGIHRQALVAKGKNRDTAWYSVIDSEAPRVLGALDRWLAPENFDEDGLQRQPLRAFQS